MKKKLCTILILISTFSAFAQTDTRGVRNKNNQQFLEKRLALVIGNGAYKNTTALDNPANDATDMARELKTLGFEVLSGTNQSKRQMETLIRDFGDKLSKQGGVGLFFYAGHGLQVRGNNYLIPVEAEIPAEDEVEYAAINLNFLLGKMDAAQNNLNIVILDACRNNPFARSWRSFRDIGDGKGLAKVTPPTGTLMLYATQPGNVASDGSGRNGLFTESLLKQISKPNVELDTMVKLLARDVSDKSGKKQLPWKEGIVLGDFYFAGTTTAAPNNNAGNNSAVNDPVPSVVIDPNSSEREAWNQIKDSTNRADFSLFIESFPNGIYAAQAKSKWETVWWNAIKNSSDKADYSTFLKEFPSGQYAGAAKFTVKRLEKAGTPSKPINTTSNNTAASKTAGAISKVRLPNNVEMSFVYIPAGSFEMGDTDDGPIHTVRISQGFQMQTTEVTQAQWGAVMGTMPKCDYGRVSNDFLGDNKPIICINWNDAHEFVRQMNEKSDGFKYRLPSGAEWEYAARAGTKGNYAGTLDSMGWYKGNSGGSIHEVGTKSPNEWGLYDMHGNVWEWCEDWYVNYPSASVIDPTGASSGSARVNRGGGWFDTAYDLRSAKNSSSTPSDRVIGLGFRVVRQ